MNEVIIKTVEAILIASTRNVFRKEEFNESLSEMWKTVNDHIIEKNAKRIVPCLMLYHTGWWDKAELNLGYDEKTLDVEVVEPVTTVFDGNVNVQVYELPKVEKMACTVHNGPFSTIGTTYDQLIEWIAQNNYVADGPIREIYHKGDWNTDSEDEYITELQIPIIRK